MFGLVERCIGAKMLEISRDHDLGDQTAPEALVRRTEMFSQAHYRAGLNGATDASDLFEDMFLFHWKAESQHAILHELE